MRAACLLVPDLPLAAERRAHPELACRPLVIASGAGPRAELVSVSPEARAYGVLPGASVAHARSLCSGLCVRVASLALERAARDALLDAAFACAPRAALAAPIGGAFAVEAAVFVDASGTTALFRTETGFATALGAQASKLGLPARVAVASSCSVARIVARRLGRQDRQEAGGAGDEPVRVLSPEHESRFLAPLPIDLLDPDDALAQTLTRFGVYTVRDLLALPRRELGSRLGSGVLELTARARGTEVEAPLPECRDRRIAEAIDLEAPVARLQALLFVIQGLLSRLLERLEARHLACGDLELALELEAGGRDARRIGVAAPTQDLRVLVRLTHLALESRPPESAVESIALETRGRPQHRDQLDLFRPAGPAPAVLGETLAALQSLCGDERVGSPSDPDTHRPDAFGMTPFAPAKLEPKAQANPFTRALALRALRPPVTAQVQLRQQRPAWVRSAIANGRVVRCAGPWRSTGGWWSREGRYAFDSFDVLTSDGTVARLRHDYVGRQWQIDAVYD